MDIALDDLRTLYRLLYNQQQEIMTLSTKLLQAEAKAAALERQQTPASELVAAHNGATHKE